MRRDELLSALQEMCWIPCQESSGPPRYRAKEAYHCTFCAYTVCARCYNAIPTSLLLSSAGAAASTSSADPVFSAGVVTIGRDADALGSPNWSVDSWNEVFDGDSSIQKPRCFLCLAGFLVREAVPVHEWTCEGPRPSRRLNRIQTVSFDTEVVQRYYTMKGQRDSRARSQAPLVCRFHHSDPPSSSFPPESIGCATMRLYPGDGGPVGRLPFCEEGGSFVCSVNNPRMEQQLVWCSVNRLLRESHPSVTGEETVTPLHSFRCPPTLPGLQPQQFRVHIPYGAYALHNVHALALFTMEDIYQKSVSRLQVSTGGDPRSPTSCPPQKGQLTTVKELPGSFVRPLLVVEVLHRVVESEPIRALLDSRLVPVQWQDIFTRANTAQKNAIDDRADNNPAEQGCGITPCENDGDSLTRCDVANGQSVQVPVCCEKDVTTPRLTWPKGLRCDELLLVVDYLLQGRSVGVYGIASKYFFLQHVVQSAELRNYAVTVVDGYQSTTSRISKRLCEVVKQLCEQRQKAEKNTIRSLFMREVHCEPFAFEKRSEAVERVPERPPQPYYHSVNTSPTAVLRSGSYCSPVDTSPCTAARVRTPAETTTDDDRQVSAKKIQKCSMPSTGVDAVPFSPSPLARPRERSLTLVESDQAIETEPAEKRGTRAVKVPQNSQKPPAKVNTLFTGDGESNRFHESMEVEKRTHTWWKRYWFREQSNWNFNVPLHEVCRVKRLHDGEVTGTSALCPTLGEQKSRKPRFNVASPELMHSLRLACRAPFRACVSWLSLPSLTVQSTLPSSVPVSSVSDCIGSDGRVKLILVVHGVDQLDAQILLELQGITRDFPYHVLLLCSFDDPNWPISNGAALLESFRMAYVQLQSFLLPRVHEMAAIRSLTLLTDLETAAAGGRCFTHFAKGERRAARNAALPLHDTIRRILSSLPEAFSELLRCMIERQEASGENVFVPMNLHQEHFAHSGLMVSMGRLRAVERELSSNRLAIFDSAENKLMIPQHRRLQKILEEMEERRRGRSTTGRAAANGS
ncbi:hypothetical protein ERJ75_000259000 [Trypanosoma vivax]|uniref:Uncharacterized protein n=1 Tax=Trypanosoma vivax (strain Y486) TaxID=1055687 RepID=G0U233_TRYVY|nr:hypothetical protein TRVL_00649 [Trypanosoma vivax]KAH8618639.1 hypothetical protein ERJ75_000259000 [Trypanosoma vivax]CCC50336.1 conserved hypothetical protein [Trypanosoma vivax Y486]